MLVGTEFRFELGGEAARRAAPDRFIQGAAQRMSALDQGGDGPPEDGRAARFGDELLGAVQHATKLPVEFDFDDYCARFRQRDRSPDEEFVDGIGRKLHAEGEVEEAAVMLVDADGKTVAARTEQDLCIAVVERLHDGFVALISQPRRDRCPERFVGLVHARAS